MHESLRFAVAALAAWRLTHLLSREDGPRDVLRTLRTRTASTLLGRLISCFYCLSVWVALPFGWFVGGSLTERAVAWWAISGAAILLDRATAPTDIAIEESDDELLRPVDGARDDQSG